MTDLTTFDRLKGAALLPPSLAFSALSPCGCRYGRICSKPQSSPHAVQSMMPDSIALALRLAFAHRGYGQQKRLLFCFCFYQNAQRQGLPVFRDKRPRRLEEGRPLHVRVRSLADNREAPQGCPLYPQKRTFVSALSMSALCQKRTYACHRPSCRQTRLQAHAGKSAHGHLADIG
jgi:hypothetical protein